MRGARRRRTSPARPAACASPTSLIRDALYEELPRRGGSRCTGARARRSRRSTATTRAASRRARAPLPSPARARARAVGYARAPATGRSRCSPTRRRPACTSWRSRRSTLRTPATSDGCELLLALGDAQTAPERRRRRQGDLPRGRGHRGAPRADAAARACRARLRRAVRVVRAGATTGSCRCSRRRLRLFGERGRRASRRAARRLAGALRDEHSRERRDALSREAVELARRPETMWRSASPSKAGRGDPLSRHDRGGRARQRAPGGRRAHGRPRAHRPGVLVWPWLGSRSASSTSVGGRRADSRSSRRELAQPIQLWQTLVDKGMFALNDGRSTRRPLIADAYAIGDRAIPELAVPRLVSRAPPRDFRGELGPSSRRCARMIALHPARRVFACALAHIHARLGDPSQPVRSSTSSPARASRSPALRPGVVPRDEPACRGRRARGRWRRSRPPVPGTPALGGIQRRGRGRGLPGIDRPVPRPACDLDRQVRRGRAALLRSARREHAHGSAAVAGVHRERLRADARAPRPPEAIESARRASANRRWRRSPSSACRRFRWWLKRA